MNPPTEFTPLKDSHRRSSKLRRAGSSRRQVVFEDDHIDMDGSLKAAVFGFNDGLCANTCLMIGIASASSITPSVVIASGMVGLFAGAASMAAGEWISMTLQNQAEQGEIQKERLHLMDFEKDEDKNLERTLKEYGFSDNTIASLNKDMTAQRDTEMKLKLHVKFELGLDLDDERGNPLKSMTFMMLAFSFGAVIPLLPWIPTWYPGPLAALWLSIFCSLIASFAVGYSMSRFTDEPALTTALRQVFAACVAIISVWGIGALYGLLGGDVSQVQG
eukprot:TRINITY_DN1586_c2_g1_i1.p1 TRINITY_DN1586_c2_g1~~TRINITY_DN1586_c2_g1_i1.p1  ORF type:complete len:275 (+),score=40.65 TRINITY_DN1586_c2_g1_i1:60-884(+)